MRGTGTDGHRPPPVPVLYLAIELSISVTLGFVTPFCTIVDSIMTATHLGVLDGHSRDCQQWGASPAHLC